jgi:isocitrate/isopropylmalate dehydrogenase
MLLRHSLNDEHGARRIENAVECAFAGGARTRELVRGNERSLETAEFTDKVIAQL